MTDRNIYSPGAGVFFKSCDFYTKIQEKPSNLCTLWPASLATFSSCRELWGLTPCQPFSVALTPPPVPREGTQPSQHPAKPRGPCQAVIAGRPISGKTASKGRLTTAAPCYIRGCRACPSVPFGPLSLVGITGPGLLWKNDACKL